MIDLSISIFVLKVIKNILFFFLKDNKRMCIFMINNNID